MVRTPAPTLTSAVASASGWTVSPAATSAAATSTGTRLEAERDHAANARPAPKTSSNPSDPGDAALLCGRRAQTGGASGAGPGRGRPVGGHPRPASPAPAPPSWPHRRVVAAEADAQARVGHDEGPFRRGRASSEEPYPPTGAPRSACERGAPDRKRGSKVVRRPPRCVRDGRARFTGVRRRPGETGQSGELRPFAPRSVKIRPPPRVVTAPRQRRRSAALACRHGDADDGPALERPVLVRERSQVQALPQAARGPRPGP